MQQQSAQRAAFADRSIPARSGAPTSQRQFAGILSHNDLTARHSCCGAVARMAHHFVGSHCRVVKETPEPHLLRSTSRKPSDTTTRSLDEGRVEGGPPFSRRRSPNRPSPNSMAAISAANQRSSTESAPKNLGNRNVCI